MNSWYNAFYDNASFYFRSILVTMLSMTMLHLILDQFLVYNAFYDIALFNFRPILGTMLSMTMLHFNLDQFFVC